MHRCAFILYVTTLLTAVSACQVLAQGGLTFPDHGVVCDKQSGFCSDAVGISLGFSEIYLGGTDEFKAFYENHNKNGFKELETRNYRFSDGTYCDHVEQWCGNPETGEPNETVMKALFSP